MGITPNRGAVIRLVGALPAAAVDRCMHDAHLVVTKGDSYRFAQARDGKGVTLLT